MFDIADTHLVRGGKTPLLWNLDSHEHEQAILDHLADTYGLSQTDSMNTALLELAQQLTADNLDEAMDGLAYEVKDTFLEELDEDNIRVRFRELMTNSIFYTLSRRCGQEPMDVLDDDDFIRIVDFNKLPVLSFLGNAVSEQCEAVLFDIGREMRKIYKKEITQQLEKSVDSLYNTNTDFSTLKRETKENTTEGGQETGVDVLPQGRLSVPESGREGRAADHREVRDAAQDVPEREPKELVSEYADERQAEPASGADRGSSGEPGGNPAGRPEREVSGTEQGERPAGMGGASEQPDGDGRGDRLEGIGIQLTEPTTEQDLSEAEEEIASAFSFPDLPTVEQQIRAIEAPIRARYADEIALDSEVVDEILRTGSNRSKAKVDVPFMMQLCGKPEHEITDELAGAIFRNPVTQQWETSDEYLSGNVREKLATAETFAANHAEYQINVDYLKRVQPKDLDASEIEVRLGANWVKPECITQFMKEVFKTPNYYAGIDIKATYSEISGAWNISGKSLDRGNPLVTNTYGTLRVNG